MRAGSVSQTIVEPYAEALMSLAKEQNLVEVIGNDIQLILSSLAASEDLKRFFSVPLVKESDRKDLIRNVFGSQVNPLTLSFLLLLVDRSRILFLEPICLQFNALLREINQVALAQVTSAVALNESQQETLQQKVKELTNAHSVELSIKVNPDLIGGVIIKVGSQVIDASIRGQLRRITSRITSGV